MIQLKKIGKYEVTLMRDVFGRYLCRFWLDNIYREHTSKNKFTASREAFLKMAPHLKFGSKKGKMEFSNSIERLKKLILVPDVIKVEIFDCKRNRKLITLTMSIHI